MSLHHYPFLFLTIIVLDLKRCVMSFCAEITEFLLFFFFIKFSLRKNYVLILKKNILTKVQSLKKEENYLGKTFYNEDVYFSLIVKRLDCFMRKRKHNLSLLSFRSMIFLTVCLISETFLKAFFLEDPGFLSLFFLFQLMSFVFCFFIFSLILKRFESAQPKSFFGEISLSKKGEDWLEAYFLGEVRENSPYGKSYLTLFEEEKYEGVSTLFKRKDLLESWLNGEINTDFEKLEKFFDFLPFYELSLYLVLFFCHFFIFIYFIHFDFF